MKQIIFAELETGHIFDVNSIENCDIIWNLNRLSRHKKHVN